MGIWHARMHSRMHANAVPEPFRPHLHVIQVDQIICAARRHVRPRSHHAFHGILQTVMRTREGVR